MNYTYKVVGTLILAIGFFVTFGFAQTDGKPVSEEHKRCEQARETKDSLIDEADREVFVLRRVSFSGNIYTHDRELRKRGNLHEGDIFTRKVLETGIKRISKMKSIYPMTIDNVEITLDRPRKDIDIHICVGQKPKR